MNTFTVVFLIAIVISYAVQFWLANRQKNFVLEHRDAVPDAFKDSVSLEAHQKAADYTVEKGKLGDIDSVAGVVFLLILTLGGAISFSFDFWSSFD
jgi:STE24 endopeptidase